ncbi:hypothetical protein Tco_0405227 [Tanacetum coccineum]
MLVSTSIIFSLANSIEYLVSTVDGTMSLKGKILAEVRLLSTRFYVLAIIVSIALTSGPSEVLSVQESHNLPNSNSRKGIPVMHSTECAVLAQLTFVEVRSSLEVKDMHEISRKGYALSGVMETLNKQILIVRWQNRDIPSSPNHCNEGSLSSAQQRGEHPAPPAPKTAKQLAARRNHEGV